MKRALKVAVAAFGYGVWGVSLYLVASTSNLIFIASGAIAAGTAIPATWSALRTPTTELAP